MNIKSILGLAAVGMMLTSCQSNSFHIKGFARQLSEGDTIYLVTDSQPEAVLASTIVRNGNFTLSGQVDSIFLCRIYANSQPDNGATLFLEPCDMTVELNMLPVTSRVSGTRINNEWQQLNDSIQLLGTQLIRLAESGTINSIDAHQQHFQTIDSLHRKMSECILNTARRNQENALGQYILQHYKEPEFQ